MSKTDDWIAFFGAIGHLQIDDVESMLLKYDIGQYIIGLEKVSDAHSETDGEHMHFMVQMSDKQYHAFSKRCFKDKYQLRGKALKDKARQYGKVQKIKDVHRMKLYTCKDGKVRSSLDEETVMALIEEASHEEWAKEYHDDMEALMAYLSSAKIEPPKDLHKEYHSGWEYGTAQDSYAILCKKVIEYYVKNQKSRKGLTRSSIESLVRKFILYYYKDIDDKDRTEWIYMSLFCKFI